MKTVRNKLTVGKQHQGLDLYCSIKMDGKELQRFRSRSFLGGFAWILQSLMHNGRERKLGHTGWGTNWADGRNNTLDNTYFNITSNNGGGTPLEISISSTSVLNGFRDKEDPHANYVYICGAPDFNGMYRGVATASNRVELYHLDGSPVDGSAGTPVGGKCVPTVGFHDRHVRENNEAGHFAANSFQSWQIIVGKAANPVSIEDVYLWDRIMPGNGNGQLDHGNLSLSPITTDKPTSRFTLSKPFTNLGEEDVTVSEIGILAHVANASASNDSYQKGNGMGYLVVRDTLDSPVSIPSGKTLSIDYELVVRLSPDTQDTDADGTNGGFLQVFMERVRNISQNTNSARADYFSLASGVGKTSVNRESGYFSDQYGIRLGDDNQFTSMTDQGLNINDESRNGYRHGWADGELYHYGNDVTQVVYDLTGNKAVFSVARIFENRTADPIQVREIGLFGNYFTGSTTNQSSWAPRLLARTALAPADQFTIAAGEYVKVEYQIEVIA